VICADFEGLIPPHHQTSLLVLFVFQQSHITGPSFLPLPGLTVKLKQLSAHLEGLLLELLVGLGLDLNRKANDRLEVEIGRVRGLVLCRESSQMLQ
jgi:hypothetical protein